jgi:hypothetical protein
MKFQWFKRVLMVAAGSIASLVATQVGFAAIQTNVRVAQLGLGTYFGHVVLRLSSASEPVVLLALGAVLIVAGVRIRQVFASEVSR